MKIDLDCAVIAYRTLERLGKWWRASFGPWNTINSHGEHREGDRLIGLPRRRPPVGRGKR